MKYFLYNNMLRYLRSSGYPQNILTRLIGKRLEPEGERIIEDRWLSVEEIAAYRGVKRDTVYKWIERKAMPAHKLAGFGNSEKIRQISGSVTAGEVILP